jgi:hypothetical protein
MVRRWPGAAPSLLLLLSAALAGAPPWAAAQNAASIADFAGTWRGIEVAEVGGDSPPAVTPAGLDLTVAPEQSGFRLSWRRPDGERVEATLAPTDRPGVFDVQPSTNPLLGLFFSPATGNPLEGETLLWSRLEGRTLVLYSLQLDQGGGFQLHRAAWTLQDDGRHLALDYSRLAEGPTKATVVARLERAAGG